LGNDHERDGGPGVVTLARQPQAIHKYHRALEDFLLRNKSFISKVVHEFGSGDRSADWFHKLYARLFEDFASGKPAEQILTGLSKDDNFAFLTFPSPRETGNGQKSGFSNQLFKTPSLYQEVKKLDLLAVEEPKPKPAKIRAVSYEAAIDQLFKRMRSSRSALTQQAVSTPRRPVPNERRRRPPPHGRRTGTAGEWPPAARGSPPAPAKDGS
jgi:hypothetical protein